jgi:hypothetical protein
MFSNEKVGESSTCFFCENCNYKTGKKYNYDKHVLTQKHLKSINFNEKVAKSSKPYMCPYCNKEYKDYSGLWRHKKNCNTQQVIQIDNEPIDKQLILMLIKENSELKTLMTEVIKNGTHNSNTNNITNNSNNKTFNLNFFLNETCKDAMNIMDFVDSIKLQLSDLVKVGEIGYIEGISSIIIQNLKNLDVTQRPIHCTDKKREVLYVKDENKWEKEDEKNSKIRKFIRRVAFKNSSLLKCFREKYPEYKNGDSRVSEKYNKIIIEAMGGKGGNESDKENKIIRNISKVVSIGKEA